MSRPMADTPKRRARYGRPRLWKNLKEDGEAIAKSASRRLMREEQIQGGVPKRFKHPTDSNYDDPIAATQLAGSRERTPDADPNAAEGL